MIKETKLKYTQKKGGRWYYVRRQQEKIVWTPLGGDPASDEAAMRLYHRLNAGLIAGGGLRPEHTVGGVVDSYLQSQRFAEKQIITQAEYRRTCSRIRAEHGKDDMRNIMRPSLIALRDRIAMQESTRQADRVVTVFSILFEHAIDLGLRTDNPARGVGRVNQAKPHRPWPSWAVDGLRKHADPTTRTILSFVSGRLSASLTCWR